LSSVTVAGYILTTGHSTFDFKRPVKTTKGQTANCQEQKNMIRSAAAKAIVTQFGVCESTQDPD
jgi:hypothetical protein